jgi:hypothetical protein
VIESGPELLPVPTHTPASSDVAASELPELPELPEDDTAVAPPTLPVAGSALGQAAEAEGSAPERVPHPEGGSQANFDTFMAVNTADNHADNGDGDADLFGDDPEFLERQARAKAAQPPQPAKFAAKMNAANAKKKKTKTAATKVNKRITKEHGKAVVPTDAEVLAKLLPDLGFAQPAKRATKKKSTKNSANTKAADNKKKKPKQRAAETVALSPVALLTVRDGY